MDMYTVLEASTINANGSLLNIEYDPACFSIKYDKYNEVHFIEVSMTIKINGIGVTLSNLDKIQNFQDYYDPIVTIAKEAIIGKFGIRSLFKTNNDYYRIYNNDPIINRNGVSVTFYYEGSSLKDIEKLPKIRGNVDFDIKKAKINLVADNAKLILRCDRPLYEFDVYSDRIVHKCIRFLKNELKFYGLELINFNILVITHNIVNIAFSAIDYGKVYLVAKYIEKAKLVDDTIILISSVTKEEAMENTKAIVAAAQSVLLVHYKRDPMPIHGFYGIKYNINTKNEVYVEFYLYEK